jgi:hypothetical protein
MNVHSLSNHDMGLFWWIATSGRDAGNTAPLLPSRPKVAIHPLTPLRGNGLLKKWAIKQGKRPIGI